MTHLAAGKVLTTAVLLQDLQIPEECVSVCEWVRVRVWSSESPPPPITTPPPPPPPPPQTHTYQIRSKKIKELCMCMFCFSPLMTHSDWYQSDILNSSELQNKQQDNQRLITRWLYSFLRVTARMLLEVGQEDPSRSGSSFQQEGRNILKQRYTEKCSMFVHFDRMPWDASTIRDRSSLSLTTALSSI